MLELEGKDPTAANRPPTAVIEPRVTDPPLKKPRIALYRVVPQLTTYEPAVTAIGAAGVALFQALSVVVSKPIV